MAVQAPGAQAEARQAGEEPQTAFALAAATMIADAIEASRDRPGRPDLPDLLDESAQAAGLEALGPVIATGAEGTARIAAHYTTLSHRPTGESARVRTHPPSADPSPTPELLLRKTHP
ncbi:hypothetical protein [Streptomyces sp. NPDC085665]|uniref:hypothetical protein n=1 Tax=Streptomyces sp. NPDC085665 TaxID=3365735 RepID=UPI0037CF3C3C